MVRIDKEYLFDGPTGSVSLSELFEGQPQLIVYHFMFDPSWDEGCPSCSFFADNVAGSLVHLKARHRFRGCVPRTAFEARVVQEAHGMDVLLVLVDR
jgi:predicted dithiol-disulfide oxidoreductase (DUF899 family)